MSKVKNWVVAFAGLSLIIGSLALIAPAEPQGKGVGNQHPLNVSVVNSPSVKVTDLYPAQPFQRELILPVNGEEVCVSVPEGKGLIIELVTARASGPEELDFYILGMRTTAGETPVSHRIVLHQQRTGLNENLLAVTQTLRAYADSGSDVCFDALEFDAGPTFAFVSLSGQLVSVP
jgi:hypothetical protein